MLDFPEHLFIAYLAKQYPDTSWTVVQLSGGVVNFTARATRVGGEGAARPVSLILKHSPPHLSRDEAFAFPQERQLVEAAALRLFDRTGALADIASDTGVRIPKVIDHDPEKFILSIEDLGPLITGHELFTPAICDALGRDQLLALATDIGQRTGRFFAQLHASGVIERINKSSHANILRSVLTRDLVYNACVKPMRGLLTGLAKLSDADAERLALRVEQDFLRETTGAEACFQIGDCHPGCILLSRPGDGAQATRAVIDWEFSTTEGGRGANGDMAQFLASMHVLLLSTRIQSATYLAAEAFTKGMCQAYAADSPWPERLRNKLIASEPAVTVLRSALILHGREMLNQMSWGSFKNQRDGSAVGPAAAVWYLEKAGDSVAAMLEADNWAELLKESTDGRLSILLTLCGLKS
jgi:hypothetical protein